MVGRPINGFRDAAHKHPWASMIGQTTICQPSADGWHTVVRTVIPMGVNGVISTPHVYDRWSATMPPKYGNHLHPWVTNNHLSTICQPLSDVLVVEKLTLLTAKVEGEKLSNGIHHFSSAHWLTELLCCHVTRDWEGGHVTFPRSPCHSLSVT